MIEKSLGEKVKKIREQAGFSQKQIASYLGIDQSLISRFENDNRPINLEYVEKICSLCGCSLATLVRNDNPSSPLKFAFRSTGLTEDNLKSIAEINQIALNLIRMQQLLEN